jgi:hypothetical protein
VTNWEIKSETLVDKFNFPPFVLVDEQAQSEGHTTNEGLKPTLHLDIQTYISTGRKDKTPTQLQLTIAIDNSIILCCTAINTVIKCAIEPFSNRRSFHAAIGKNRALVCHDDWHARPV